MTRSTCLNTCSSKGRPIAAVGGGSTCWCFSSSSGFVATRETGSNAVLKACAGNSNEFCGGQSKNYVQFIKGFSPSGAEDGKTVIEEDADTEDENESSSTPGWAIGMIVLGTIVVVLLFALIALLLVK